jgi:RND family efflux transporter MFP subunit
VKRALIAVGVAGLVVIPIVVLASMPRAVTVAAVTRGRALQAVYATGMVEADPRVELKARLAGTLRDLAVREGATVTRGQLLARVENRSLTFDLRRGEADLRAASARARAESPQLAELEARRAALAAELAQAEDELKRDEQLRASQAIPEETVSRSRRKVTRLKAELGAQDARRRATRSDLAAERARLGAVAGSLASVVEDSFVRSPLDGVVLRRRVEEGEAVTQGQPLFTVGDTARLLLEVKIDEADVGQVRVGQGVAINLYAWPARVFQGAVTEIYPDAERETKTFLARVRITDPPPGLRSGMSAEVNIVTAEKLDALLVPAAAVLGMREAAPDRPCRKTGGTCYEGTAWVVRDGRAARRDVTLGLRDVRQVEILAGLDAGEQVVVLGGKGLRDGARVRVRAK